MDVARPGWNGRSRLRALISTLLMLGLVTWGSPTERAMAGGDALESEAFRDGEWLATMGAMGTLDGSAEGVRMVWKGAMSGDAWFVVEDGVVHEGEWDVTGTGFIVGEHPMGGQATIDQSYQIGGWVEGDAEVLLLAGEQQWESVMEAGATSMVVGPETSPIPPIEVTIVHLSCNEIVADWIAPLSMEAVASGWSDPQIRGDFIGFYQGSAIDVGLRDRLDTFFDQVQEFSDDVMANKRIDDARVAELFETAMALEQEWREAGVVDGCLFGLEEDAYVSLFTSELQYLAVELMHRVELSGLELGGLVDLLLSVGAIGEGAINPEWAELVEESILEQVERVVAEGIVREGTNPDGGDCAETPCLFFTDDIVEAIHIASRLGFDLTVVPGTTFPWQDLVDLVVGKSKEDVG